MFLCAIDNNDTEFLSIQPIANHDTIIIIRSI